MKNKSDNQNFELLELAVKCRLISEEKETQIMDQASVASAKDTEAAVVDALIEQQILEKDQVEFLFLVRNHLNLLMLDKKFGKMGVVNNFVRRKDVDKALEIQLDVFKRQQKSLKIGDILVHKHKMSESDRTAILLTQDRIRDEYLAEALNVIAKDEMERSQISKRFGAIAVKKKLITREQLNQALKIQKQEALEKGKKQYLGEILKERYKLSKADIIGILKIQKQLEVKRMNLQKNVFAFNVQNESVKVLDHFLSLDVSQDKLSAFISFKEQSPIKIDCKDVLNWLHRAGIKYGVRTENEISAFIEKREPGKRFEIAQGRPAVPPKEERVKYRVDVPIKPGGDKIVSDGNTRVNKDDVIATVTPFEPGVSGRDVFGHPTGTPADLPMLLGHGKGITRTGNDFIALSDGILKIYENRTLFVVPGKIKAEPREIHGDLTPDIAEDFLNCDLKISGSIAAGAAVACNRLTVKGDVLGSIVATGDVEIHGNVGDGRNSEDSDGGHAVQIKTDGRIKVKGKQICAEIVVDNGLVAPRAEVVNSRVFSSGDVTVKSVVSNKTRPSVLRIAPKNTMEIEKYDKMIDCERDGLNKLTCETEQNELAKELMTHIQIQQDYLEEQRVLAYLRSIVNDPALKEIESIEDKITAFESSKGIEAKKEMQEKIPEKTKARRYLLKVAGEMNAVDPKQYGIFIGELHDNLAGILKSAVRSTDRCNKKYEARCKQIGTQKAEHQSVIREKEERIRDVLAQKDYLKMESKQSGPHEQLQITVKNKLGQHTVVQGKKARFVVKESVHGVLIKETAAIKGKAAQMVIQGAFE